jgi:hypothetical protein
VKLNLLFIVMDLLTLLAYPVVYMHGLLRQASGSRKNSPRLKMLAVVPLTPGG